MENKVASDDNTMKEHSTHNPLIKDSNPEPDTGRDSLVWRRDKMVKKFLIKIAKCGLLYFRLKKVINEYDGERFNLTDLRMFISR
jgi:hypothetical protein